MNKGRDHEGWTNDYEIFKNFIEKKVNEDERIKEYYELINTNLSHLGNEYFKVDLQNRKDGFNKTPSKKDFLIFHIKRVRIDPELLTKRNFNNGYEKDEAIKMGYSFGLNQTDFKIWDFIDPNKNLNPFNYLAISSESLKPFYEVLYGNSLPLTIENIFEKFNRYIIQFKLIAKGYSQFLMQNELQKMLNELESKYENYTKPHIETNNFNGKKLKWTGTPAQFGFIINELIGKGYIEKPTGSYNKDAEFYLSIFNIETTPGNLSNEVNINKNSFSANNALKFTIPNKDKLG